MWDWAYPVVKYSCQTIGVSFLITCCRGVVSTNFRTDGEGANRSRAYDHAAVPRNNSRDSRSNSGAEKVYDLTFIGALYDYRVQLIDQLRADGVNVAVNPHRPDVTADYHESRANQPSLS